HDDPGADLWSDTTTLYITVREAGSGSHVLGRGVLTISPTDFLKQMTTFEVTNARSLLERLQATVRFGRFFAGTLYDTYGGTIAKPHYFNPDAAPRKKRPLRVGAPVIYRFQTKDRIPLR